MVISDGKNSTPLTDITSYNRQPNTSRLLKAIEERSIESVQGYINTGVVINAFGGAFHESPLHKAAQTGWTEGVELLLANGADVYSKNHYDQTPLHYACASKSCEIVRLLLNEKCIATLHQRDRRGHTPLHDASATGCVKCVMSLLHAGATVNVTDINDETPLHKAAKASSIPTMLVLLNKGANLGAKDKTGESALSYVLRHIPGGIDTLFDHCLVTNTNKVSYKKLEICFNFLPISGDSEKNQVKNLRDVVELGYPKLLLHPLCESYLLLKWVNVRRYFFFEVIFYFTYAILASLLILDKFVFTVYEPIKIKFPPKMFEGLEVVVLLQAVFILLKEGLMICQGIRTWIYSVWHVSNGVISILVLLVLPGERCYWQHHLASIVVLLLWVQCMLHISRFPSCGIYVAMFTKVAKVFLRIFSIFFCLLLAFSMSFYVSKYGHSYSGSIKDVKNKMEVEVDKVYSDPGLTFFKTLTMMIGELDFDGAFVNELNILPGTSHVIYLSFIILVSVILSNLLVALAVNDVQGLRNSAYLERLIKQMELVFQIEKTFSTLDSIAACLNLKRFTQRRKSLMHDLLNAKVTLEPYDPQKGTSILISDKGIKKEVSVKKGLITSILQCLKMREDTSTTGNRKMSVKRIPTRPIGTGPEEVQELLKTVESVVTELSGRMEDLAVLCISMESRLRSMEESMSTSLCTGMSRAYSNSDTSSLERNPLVMSPEEALIVQQSNENEIPI